MTICSGIHVADVAAIVTGLGTLVLAGVTLVLASHTKRAADETARARVASFRPVVVPDGLAGQQLPDGTYPEFGVLSLGLRNVGEGSALEIRFRLNGTEISAGPDLRPISVLAAGERIDLAVPTRPRQELQDRDLIDLDIMYNDVSGGRWVTIARSEVGQWRWVHASRGDDNREYTAAADAE